MLKETYRLHQKLRKELPFSLVISIFLEIDLLNIQIRFRKNKVPFYFNYALTKKEIITNNEEDLISFFVAKVKAFYNKANEEDFTANNMLDQTRIENSTT